LPFAGERHALLRLSALQELAPFHRLRSVAARVPASLLLSNRGGSCLIFAFSPSLTRRRANPATPSARSVNSCAASRCQRLEFKRLEIVDMLRITSFKARASGAQRQCPGRERPLTAARAGTRCARRRGILRQAGSPNAHQRRYRGCAGLSRSSPPPSPAARRSPTWWVAAAKVEPSAPRLLRLFQPTRL